MKIPSYISITTEDDLLNRARILADELTLEYGIFVEVEYSSEKKVAPLFHSGVKRPLYSHYISEIQFKIGDQLFDTLKDVRKALQNKAFI